MSANVEFVEFASPRTSFATLEDIRNVKVQIRDIQKQLTKHDDIIKSQQVRNIGSFGEDETSPSIKNEDPLSVCNAEMEAIDVGTHNIAFSSAPPPFGKIETSVFN